MEFKITTMEHMHALAEIAINNGFSCNIENYGKYLIMNVIDKENKVEVSVDD